VGGGELGGGGGVPSALEKRRLLGVLHKKTEIGLSPQNRLHKITVKSKIGFRWKNRKKERAARMKGGEEVPLLKLGSGADCDDLGD